MKKLLTVLLFLEAYYDRTTDKQQAIEDILTFKNAEKFLAASGYAEKFK